MVSNTTESGIQYTPEELKLGTPVQSFPGKLAAYLYHRYYCFDGAASAGMTIVPCELIDNNGDKLREIVLHHADDWGLPHPFTEWVRSHNHFCNTLVDRIVTGFPQGEDAHDLLFALSYRDELVTVGEPFHLWAIEADERLKREWQFEKIGLNVPYVSDVTPYRMQKVRILNGAHTAMCALGLLSGLQTVGEVMNHPVLGLFVQRLMNEEIVPTLLSSIPAVDKAKVVEFAGSVVDRFKNPFVHHELDSITLNGLSKIRVRLLPTLYEFYQNHERVPALLSAAIAAQLLFYRNADNPTERWTIRDDAEMVQMIADIWSEETAVGLEATISMLLGKTELWNQDLNEIDGLREGIAAFIRSARAHGTISALESVICAIGEK
ncbi:tagaturonate reductase [Alicyclobacillus fastidiosus]|uniref:tagaturonate reductase n=1 Tax=Alicyclobacillus fastidiosus TaxID=392011 RepID=UPI0023EA1EB4|nr:tagaturonate reductase [Alicyclobacillus fastidiosus]GMA62867.1 altronate oxidoreductase [Alicyclobacillus fastidiosus]